MGMYGMIVMGVILLCEAGDEKVDPGVSKILILQENYNFIFHFERAVGFFASPLHCHTELPK